METLRIGDNFTAFFHPELGANVGMVRTSEGTLLIDTTSSPPEIQALLAAAGVSPEDVRLVINTHFHSDHTWGNQLFTCPILAHRLCQERMRSALEGEWSSQELRAYLSELEKTDQVKAGEFRRVLDGLHINLPDQVFDDHYLGELGGVRYELIHLGGHTPDSSIVWLPDLGILYASDLIFQGRYPYIFDADIPTWVEALDQLLTYGAEVIIPGHGIRCGVAEIVTVRDYLQQTWELTTEHIRRGHSEVETIADPHYPVFPGEKYARLHRANISFMYKKLLKHT